MDSSNKNAFYSVTYSPSCHQKFMRNTKKAVLKNVQTALFNIMKVDGDWSYYYFTKIPFEAV